jgi:proton-dependent oligopeptide transporter, POT family
VATTSAAAVPLRSQPTGLLIIVLTEIWERFSFYGMRALLIFYLTKHFRFDDHAALDIYATYLGLLYLTPIFGGIAANRWLGFRRAVVLGAVLMALGHFAMAFEGSAATVTGGIVTRDPMSIRFLFGGLTLIATGNGFFKPSLAALLGSLYEPNDPRRDGGFTWLVIGVNVGAALAAAICGYLGQTFGWSYGFGSAGGGMLLGLVVFLAGRRFVPEPLQLARPSFIRATALVTMVLALTWVLMREHAAVGVILVACFMALTAWILLRARRDPDPGARGRLIGLVMLTMISVLFWALLDQTGSSINLLTDRYTDTRIAGLQFRSSQFLALSPLFALFIGPFLAALWTQLAKRGQDPGPLVKFAAGLSALSLCFAILAAGIHWVWPGTLLPASWVVSAYLAHAAGELCVSPIGLSAITELSPKKMVGALVGYWFLAVSLGTFLSGTLAKQGVQPGSPVVQLHGFATLFMHMALLGVLTGLLLMAISPLLRRYLPDLVRAHSRGSRIR